MDDILNKVHEAGLTLKAGCGIGYEFSTLRPRGAYVAGAGAHTSGPMSFMDIYDRMCFTVSSAGGRRGAQMGTFDVGHPDAMDFIRAKRENGRLRQFNLSLLVTDEFIDAVRADREWKLAFPLSQREYDPAKYDLHDPHAFVWREWPDADGYVANEEGLVACKIYKVLPARRLWDVIMASTYDFAEPGFVLIDRVNEMNNNWWCENIRATNPCVTADTWIHTADGPRQVADLIGRPFVARLDGQDHLSSPQGFYRTASRPVLRVQTAEGYALRLTADHRLRRVTGYVAGTPQTEWCAAGELRAGDRLLLNDHRAANHWGGAHTREQGYLTGLLIGDGTLKEDKAVLSAWLPALAVNAREELTAVGVRAIPQDYLNVGKVLRLSRWTMLWKILLPATLPYMFTGFRLSLGIAWLVIVAAEMLTGVPGVGGFLWQEYNSLIYEHIILSILTIGIVGFALDRLMSLVEQRLKFA